MRCPVGGIEEDQKIADFGSAYNRDHFPAGEKKALLSKTFLNFGAQGRLASSRDIKAYSLIGGFGIHVGIHKEAC